MAKFKKTQTDRIYYALGSLLSRLEWKEPYDELTEEIKSAVLEGADPAPLIKIRNLINECLTE